jgi:hypothetical protein
MKRTSWNFNMKLKDPVRIPIGIAIPIGIWPI